MTTVTMPPVIVMMTPVRMPACRVSREHAIAVVVVKPGAIVEVPARQITAPSKC
jgi:hypothetical protein